MRAVQRNLYSAMGKAKINITIKENLDKRIIWSACFF